MCEGGAGVRWALTEHCCVEGHGAVCESERGHDEQSGDRSEPRVESVEHRPARRGHFGRRQRKRRHDARDVCVHAPLEEAEPERNARCDHEGHAALVRLALGVPERGADGGGGGEVGEGDGLRKAERSARRGGPGDQ